jgi:spheroidene monooxygenase
VQVISLSFFRFNTLRDRLWAFSQMQFARGPLRRVPGIGFSKLLGTGTREGFHPFPNFGVYAILATWPDLAHAQQQVREAGVFSRYRQHASEDWTVFLQASRCRGRWAGEEPFEVADAGPAVPVAVLTRATVKLRAVVPFWRRVPNISAMIRRQDQLAFKAGLGEIPWVHQVTFSIWNDLDAMRAFAYESFHGEAIEQVRRGDWFREELFARFHVVGSEGRWEGKSPLEAPARVAHA